MDVGTTLQTALLFVVKPLLCWTDEFFETKVLLEHNRALKAAWRDWFSTFTFSQESQFLLVSQKRRAVGFQTASKATGITSTHIHLPLTPCLRSAVQRLRSNWGRGKGMGYDTGDREGGEKP